MSVKAICFIVISVIALIFSGCATTINISDHFDRNSPLTLTTSKLDSLTGLTTSASVQIPASADKYKKLIEWSNENTSGWRWSPASYIANLYVGQGNFRLLYSVQGNGVVLGFTDKKGKPRQYAKAIKKGELDFLLN